MRFGSLFAGIGGFDLGLERAGMECAWQVEIDPFCRKVLTKHWPDVPKYEDVRDVGAHNLAPVDLICGGFPCPVVSQAARGRNVGEWLWPDFRRIISCLRPSFVLLENVPGLRYADRGFGDVLGDLAQVGYNSTWCEFPAAFFGAPHKRARLWLVAYPHGHRKPDVFIHAKAQIVSEHGEVVRRWPNPPAGLRVDDGLPDRVDRNRALGNAVVPQVAEWIGRRIMEVGV